ncbi:conserved hypothetical protein [uncultured delta proteobacterium]|uniref:Uncharacterized protein n=1 Tax=uncultured delta proteobacterium TaxID=34034 RepID=A0A212JYY2_9DELT|nr:conserved hypothetical protein [uncultured delta proteobacterium]
MHILFLILGIALIGALIFYKPGQRPARKPGSDFTGFPGPLSKEERRAVNEALEAKGKLPWIMREKGTGALTFKGGGMLTENFDFLDAYEARTSLDIRDEKPVFDDDYANQQGKADTLSRLLERHLAASLPFPFKALAGESRVDVVTLADYGNTAYVFIVNKTPGNFVIRIDKGHFYYDVPTVLKTLEAFIDGNPPMDRVIWVERDTNFFMFVVQQKLP